MNIGNKTFEHLDGKVRLLDGRTLDCYQSEEKKIEADSELSLFLDNAFVLLEEQERILSDIRAQAVSVILR